MRLSSTFVVAVTLLMAFATQSHALDAETFVASIAGQYHITRVNGEKPKENNSLADVYADADEGALTMPYCLPGGLCDPGYLFLGYATTRITQSMSHGVVRYDIYSEGDRYSWEDLGSGYRFTNYQYLLNGAPIALIHELSKVR